MVTRSRSAWSPRALPLVVLFVTTACTTSSEGVSTPTATASVVATPSAAVSPGTEPEPLTEPSLRGYHAMVEAGDLGVLMLGGYFAEGPPGCCAPDAAWAYSTPGGWTDLGLTPDVIPDLDDAVYDTASEMAVIYNSAEGFSTYDPDTKRVEPTASGGPSGLFAARMAYDAGSDRIVLFGGASAGDFLANPNPETWSYDVDTNTWTRMHPKVSPPGRTWHGMAYDAKADRIVVFGGFDASDEYLGDTWTYDLDTDTWTEVTTKGGPGPRAYFDMAYDPTTDWTILFGGATGPWSAEDVHGDTWAFDAERGRWTELAPDIAPGPRGWHAMAYDATGEVIVLFGGGPSRNDYTAETWIFDGRRGTWTELT